MEHWKVWRYRHEGLKISECVYVLIWKIRVLYTIYKIRLLEGDPAIFIRWSSFLSSWIIWNSCYCTEGVALAKAWAAEIASSLALREPKASVDCAGSYSSAMENCLEPIGFEASECTESTGRTFHSGTKRKKESQPCPSGSKSAAASMFKDRSARTIVGRTFAGAVEARA